MILIGYSGHSYVIHGIFASAGIKVIGYCDKDEKSFNPFSLTYFGVETYTKNLLILFRLPILV